MRRKGSFIVIILLAVSLLQGNTPQNLPIENRTVVWEESVPVSLLVSPTATPLSAPGPDIRPIAAESVMAKYTPEPVPTPYGPISDIPPSTPSPGGAVTQSAQLRQKEASFDQNNGYVSTEKGLKVPILMYHNLFEGNKKGDGLNVSEKTFEDQLATLAAFGYSTITFEELYRHYNENVALPKNPVIITFDDGYRSSYTLAFPLLKSYGMKACIFMICDAIGSSNFMTKTQLKELSDSGLIEIQSHSVSK